MKPLNLGLLAVFLMLAAPSAHAQQGTVRDMVFSEVEKRIIREHYGKPADQQTAQDRSAPDWALKDGGGESDDGEDQDRAKPETGDTGKKDKGKKDKGKGDKGKQDKGKKDREQADQEDGKSRQMPPGLAKRDQLPPGLARQLKEKGRLPPGIAKRDLPADLTAKLPQRPEDQEVTIVEGDVVLTDKATGVILDVIKDVVTNGAGGATPANPDGTNAAPGPQDGGAQDSLLDTILKGVFGGGN